MTKDVQRIVAVDSQTLVWGIRQEGDPSQIERALWLFEGLEEENAQIIVPAVVVAEYLVPVNWTFAKSNFAA